MIRRISAFLIILITFKSYGQEKFTLQQCVDYAMKNNVSIKQSDVQARISAITLNQSTMALYPYLTGSVNSSYQHGLTTNPTTNILESSSYVAGSMNVQASYNIFNWNARKNTIEANRLNLKADQVGVDKAKNAGKGWCCCR